ncbi:cyclic nucleotide-binding domain-containing protein [Metabacillus halosaccharovorans]|nr:cyclic nucleotide-binding domain-containing protein [Metabacillus halosaccharovorans]
MSMSELKHLLKDYYPFSLLTEFQLQELTDKASQKQFSKNEFIFHEDEAVDDIDLYFLVSGLAKNILHQSNGKQLSLRYYYPGDIIGLMVMFTSGELNFSVQALENCTVFKLNKRHFFEIMTRNNDFSKVIWGSIGERTKSLYDEMKNKASQDDDEENVHLLKTRVKLLMDPPIFVPPHYTMSDAAKMLKDQNASGLIVSRDSSKMLGMITYDEILTFASTSSGTNLVSDWMNPIPVYVDADAFAFEALSFIKNKLSKCIAVLNNQKVIGMLTSRSFLNLENSSYLDLTYNVKKSTSLEDLVMHGPLVNKTLHAFVQELVEKESYAYEVSEMITNHNDNLHRHMIKLTENEMKQQGYGTPPINFCFIIMGSQARNEQGFRTDQDNGMILADYEHLSNREQIEKYFNTFTQKLNTSLRQLGFPECTGGIMAKEEKWRRSVSQWKKDIQTWKDELDAQEIQNFTMFYDFRPIYGDFSLAGEVRTFLNEKAQHSKTLQQLLMKDALRFKISAHPFGLINIKQKNKKINVKKTGLTQIIYSTRINAIKYGINEVSTIKRLNALKNIQAMHPRDVENAKTALHYLHYFRLRQNLKELENNNHVSNEIPIHDLTKEDRMKLKEALQVAHRMQQVTKISFNRNRVV